MPTDETTFTQDAVAKAMASSRSRSFAGKAIVPRYVKEHCSRLVSILDYGCGKHEVHVEDLRASGFFRVHGHDFHNPNPDALARRYEVVYASNVLNVQADEAMLRRTLQEIVRCVERGGRFIANYPVSPRYLSLHAREVLRIVEEVFACEVWVVSGGKSAPMFVVRNYRAE